MTIAGLSVLNAVLAARRLGVDTPSILRGLSFSEGELARGRAWIPWPEVATLSERLGATLGDDDTHIDAIASRDVEAHPIHRMLAPLFADPNRWIDAFWKIEAALQPALRLSYDVDEHEHRLEVALDPARPTSPTWLRLVLARGRFAARPLGAAPLTVLDAEIGATRLVARYRPAREVASEERRHREPQASLASVIDALAAVGAQLDPLLLDGNLVADPHATTGRSEAELLCEDWKLTPTEARVATALADGKSPARIAAELSIAVSTVRVHLKHVYAKSEVSGQRELVDRIARWRLR